MNTLVREDTQVWCDDEGLPARMVWRAERWRVIDMPTVMEHSLWPTLRFTVRSEVDAARTLVVDVERIGGRWALVSSYE